MSVKIKSGELTRMILSDKCPFCERKKLDGHCFCDTCYMKLPEGLRSKIKNGLRQLSEGIRGGVEFLGRQ